VLSAKTKYDEQWGRESLDPKRCCNTIQNQQGNVAVNKVVTLCTGHSSNSQPRRSPEKIFFIFRTKTGIGIFAKTKVLSA
jgi:hypothetical protein